QGTTVTSVPSLGVSIADATDPVSSGGSLIYTIIYNNGGLSTASGVVVTAAYDPLLNFTNAVPPPDAGTNNRWTIGTLRSNQSGTIEVTLAVPALSNGTPLTTQVSVHDGGTQSGTATESTTVAAPIFTASAADSADPVTSGGAEQLTVNYTNV